MKLELLGALVLIAAVACSQEATVWVASPWEHVLKSTEPGLARSVEVEAAANEYEPFRVIVRAGEIIPVERGDNGFGYDPIFLLPELGCTMAELSMAEKNLLSHRARALKAALPMLRQLVRGG